VANIKSQIKRIKTNEKARLRNKSVKSSLKTGRPQVPRGRAAGDAAAATTLMREASRALDKAASKGVIHANQAANRKSAMAKQTAGLAASPLSAVPTAPVLVDRRRRRSRGRSSRRRRRGP
jgi:small subunit ribosomal protein S20